MGNIWLAVIEKSSARGDFPSDGTLGEKSGSLTKVGVGEGGNSNVGLTAVVMSENLRNELEPTACIQPGTYGLCGQ